MFTKLIGNEPAKLGLRRLLAKGRLPNSLIFAGDEGVGKRHFAIEIAKAFVCREPLEGEPCGVCSTCLRAERFEFPKPDKKDDHKKVVFSEHPDVSAVIPFNRNILVDAIRDLEREANFLPFEARARFFIVDNAEKMNANAANALLKTLEEPPPTTYIILITSRPDSLLPTIRSRCQLIRFAPVEPEHIERFLIADRAFSHDEARLAARFSRGSVGRAVSMNVQDFRARRERMLAVLEGVIHTGERARPLKISEEMNDAKNKDRFEDNLDILESLIHDIWSMQISGDAARLTNADLETELVRLVDMAAGADLDGWLRQIEHIRMDLIVNINRRIATDALFVTMGGN